MAKNLEKMAVLSQLVFQICSDMRTCAAYDSTVHAMGFDAICVDTQEDLNQIDESRLAGLGIDLDQLNKWLQSKHDYLTKMREKF